MSETTTKRRRLVLSCFECKRRKLKCGRETPICSRCINVGTPEVCEYDPRFSMNTDTDVAGLACANQAWSPKNSISQLPTTTFDNFDASLISDNCQPNLWLPFQHDLDLESSSSEVLDSESLIESFKLQMQQPFPDQRKSLNGRFRGLSHSTSIVASFPDLYRFMKQIVEDHHILGAPQWATYTPSAEQPLPFYSKEEVEQAIKRLLPAEERCRRLSKSYFDHFTGIYALFHVPSFWHEYQDYWDGTHNDPVRFNAMLLAVMSCSRCLFADDPLSFDGDSSTARNEAVKWLHAVEAWQNYRAATNSTIEAFQIKCLVLLSKTLNDIGREDHYTASQTLLADAISNGLHRDWKLLGVEESVYEREIRRKVWSAVAELDIAACIERGVPSMVSNLLADIGQPKGYNDCDYFSNTEFEPPDQPDCQLTDNSFAKIAHSIRPLRYEINDFVNNPQKHRSLNQSHLVALRVQISKAMDGIPSWSDPAPDVAGRNRGLVYRAVLELYLHELLLLLHLPFALTTDGAVSSAIDTDFQRFICVRSASTIIKIHELVAHEGFSPIALGNANLLRAGLCLCLLEGGALNYGITSLPVCPDAQTKLVNSALGMVEQRVLSLGTGLQSLWLFSVASCYIESRRDPSSSSVSKNRTTDEIVALFSKMCWAQVQKSIGFGLSDTHIARYILQVHQVCEAIGQMMGSKTGLDVGSVLARAGSISMKSAH
ncbi:hypothetical protein P153DRAFT_433970 [Dothidotthia symphoricarpi CBS 119687]|uniref:Zn(2)-C6 fungal-type domain-containing protein n=1 Tax=Dothidotthia symphoricarpi CBS 119687 TaxID=1392245 RepID=A0A6A6A2U0_9PLEO|nr:uncharacterized protein P153DRAFT_433970 [Dothidotthia symphoricarpi CBS 119687]KAF2126179.1 hypothetical protein P153DRAFT_433970 [Dothidotthia symphoricarpi CBS 119687]